ncbi:hypothetical protein BHM03_00000066 [Ensete ventricosum]|uniref:Uncharacterized protein n=1 Tax=Ensete ventricosum TaxID=4639 RepID=A0A445M8A0_ENSVE|nr:hypothetical protein BHM03_00000066 [Ensete ventricosum]
MLALLSLSGLVVFWRLSISSSGVCGAVLSPSFWSGGAGRAGAGVRWKKSACACFIVSFDPRRRSLAVGRRCTPEVYKGGRGRRGGEGRRRTKNKEGRGRWNMATVSRNMVVLGLCLLLLVVASSGVAVNCNLHENCFYDCTGKGYWRVKCMACFFCDPELDNDVGPAA